MVERNRQHVKEKSSLVSKTRSISRDRAKDTREGKGENQMRSRSLADRREPAGRGRPSQIESPPLPAQQSRRKSSPDAVDGRSHRSRLDRHRPQGSRKEFQENQDPVVNGHRSPPIPTLRKQTGAVSTEPLPSQRGHSPPVPALKHRNDNDYNIDAYAFDSTNINNKIDTHRSRYGDAGPISPEVNGDFVPFVRTANILDPSVAAIPLPITKEPTVIRQAREGYVHSTKPASYGMEMPNLKDPSIYPEPNGPTPVSEMPLMPELGRIKVSQQLSVSQRNKVGALFY